jgi:hypothetical protein
MTISPKLTAYFEESSVPMACDRFLITSGSTYVKVVVLDLPAFMHTSLAMITSLPTARFLVATIRGHLT